MKYKNLLLILLTVTLVSLSYVSVFAQTSETQGIASRIEGLPPIEDIGENQVKEVKGLMEAYAELPMSERMHIENYKKLKESYDKLVRDGYITNEMQAEVEEKQNLSNKQKGRQESGKVATKETEYTFKISRNEQLTIMLRYTADINDDGITDAPDRITMTSPTGQTYPISNASVMLKDESITNALTWTDNYLQMDIGAAEEGKWTIQTSVPVTFSQESYQGAAVSLEPESNDVSDPADRGIVYDENGNPINPEDKDSKKTSSDTGKSPKANEEKKAKKGGLGGVMLILLLLGLLGGLFFFIKKKGSSGGGGKAPDRGDDLVDAPKPLSDDEIMAKLKQEYEQEKKQEEEMDEANREMSTRSSYVPSKGKRNPYMDSDDDVEEDEVGDSFQEYSEGDTGLLDEEDKKEHFNDEDDDDSSFFESI